MFQKKCTVRPMDPLLIPFVGCTITDHTLRGTVLAVAKCSACCPYGEGTVFPLNSATLIFPPPKKKPEGLNFPIVVHNYI